VARKNKLMADLTNVTSPEHERWKRAHPEVCRQMGIG